MTLKFLTESPGFALTSSGGRVSFNPPCGGTMLAQPEPPMTLKEMIVMIAMNDIIALKFMGWLQT
ncbi:MAG: hypothetical protein JJE22_10700 [Bacteroidia bacterium]|nr:hypothetical protein [Bacteroidia bacterium]